MIAPMGPLMKETGQLVPEVLSHGSDRATHQPLIAWGDADSRSGRQTSDVHGAVVIPPCVVVLELLC